MLERAHDADAGDVDGGVLGHGDLAAAHDRHHVNGDLGLGERASRMSISPPPMSMKALKVLGTTQSPLREKPPRMAMAVCDVPIPAVLPHVARGRLRRRGNVRGPGAGQVVRDRHELRVGFRRVHGVESLVELVHGQVPVPRGLAELLRDAFPVGVRGAQVLGVRYGGRGTHIAKA